jgi:hypothetical protein
LSQLKKIFSIKKEELPFSLLMAGYFFLVITSFWILKPIKKAEFIDYYKNIGGFDLFGWHMPGSEAELLAKIANMIVAAIAVALCFSRKYIRQQLTYIFSAFSIASWSISFARQSQGRNRLDILFVWGPFQYIDGSHFFCILKRQR